MNNVIDPKIIVSAFKSFGVASVTKISEDAVSNNTFDFLNSIF